MVPQTSWAPCVIVVIALMLDMPSSGNCRRSIIVQDPLPWAGLIFSIISRHAHPTLSLQVFASSSYCCTNGPSKSVISVPHNVSATPSFPTGSRIAVHHLKLIPRRAGEVTTDPGYVLSMPIGFCVAHILYYTISHTIIGPLDPPCLDHFAVADWRELAYTYWGRSPMQPVWGRIGPGRNSMSLYSRVIIVPKRVCCSCYRRGCRLRDLRAVTTIVPKRVRS